MNGHFRREFSARGARDEQSPSSGLRRDTRGSSPPPRMEQMIAWQTQVLTRSSRIAPMFSAEGPIPLDFRAACRLHMERNWNAKAVTGDSQQGGTEP